MKRKNGNTILFCILLLILVSVTLVGCTSTENSVVSLDRELTTEEKIEDFEYMYKTLEENYPFFKVNERVNEVNWLANKDEYEKRIRKTRNDEEFANELNMIICELHNDHTHLILKDDIDYYYNIYVNDSYGLKKISKPWTKVLNEDKVKARYNFNKKRLKQSNKENYEETSSSAEFTSDIIVPNEVAYLQIKKIYGSRIEEDEILIRNFLESVKNYPKLIIDIRGSRGGYNLYWVNNIVLPLIKEPLSTKYYVFAKNGENSKKFYKARNLNMKSISELDEELVSKFPEEVKTDFSYYSVFETQISPNDPVDFNGKIYLLVDRRVYSSSDQLASFAKETGFATLVGERTGGDGIGIDPLLFSLPNSGLVVRYSSLLCLNPDYTINEEVQTTPDIELPPFSPVDYKYDECIQYVIEDEI